jgi:hypothetical protein
MVCEMSSTRVGIYIEGLGMKFVIFCNFFRIFWTPNGQKRLLATASTRGPIRSRHVDQSDRATRHVALARALAPPVPRLPLASLSPRSRPGGRSSAGESEAISPALAGRQRHRPAPASRPPIARAAARTGTSLTMSSQQQVEEGNIDCRSLSAHGDALKIKRSLNTETIFIFVFFYKKNKKIITTTISVIQNIRNESVRKIHRL